MSETELILVNISGSDRPGVTSALTEVLARYDASILDIGQADIHHTLSLGLLFKTNASVSGNIMKELLFKASELGVQIKFTPVTRYDYEQSVTNIIAAQKLNIDSIQRLTGRAPLDEDVESKARACVEFSVRGNPTDLQQMQSEFMRLSATEDFDISLQEDTMYRRCRRLVCFDMDSTLIETEVIDELAVRAGVGDKVKEITARAMRGEIDFDESFRERVALLQGLDESVMRDIAEKLPVTEGVERMMCVLKRAGFKTAILSGGFTYFGNYLKNKFGFDYVYANELEIQDGRLTGRYLGEIINGRRKAELLRLLAQVENINIAQTIAVGDGANDLPMLTTAGLGIAFHAKPKVKATAGQSISTIGLDGVLYFIGFKDSFISDGSNTFNY